MGSPGTLYSPDWNPTSPGRVWAMAGVIVHYVLAWPLSTDTRNRTRERSASDPPINQFPLFPTPFGTREPATTRTQHASCVFFCAVFFCVVCAFFRASFSVCL